MKSAIKTAAVVLTVIILPFVVSAATLYLKSGKTVAGEVLEQTDAYITIDFYGIPLKYYHDQIERAEGVSQVLAQPSATAVSPDAQKLYDFRLGSHDIDGNNVNFEFPGSMDTLYAFNLQNWQGQRSDEAKLVMKLYGKDRQQVSSGESVCISKQFNSFGSLFFSGVSKETVSDIAYFSLSVEDCGAASAAAADGGPVSGAGELHEIYMNSIKAMQEGNVEELKKYMLRDGVAEMETMADSMGGMEQALKMMAQMSPTDLQNIDESITGDEAVLSAIGIGMFGGEAKITITFQKEDGVWKVNEVKTAEGS